MRLPLRVAYNDLNYVDFSLVDLNGKVVCLVPFSQDSISRMNAHKQAIEIANVLNESYYRVVTEDLKKGPETSAPVDKEPVTAGTHWSAIRPPEPVDPTKKRPGNPNWFKGWKK